MSGTPAIPERRTFPIIRELRHVARLSLPREVPRRVPVTDVYPERPVVAQHATHLPEDVHHRPEPRLRRRLQPDLSSHAIVAKPPIRRARHDALHARGGTLRQHGAAIPLKNRDAHAMLRWARRLRASTRHSASCG